MPRRDAGVNNEVFMYIGVLAVEACCSSRIVEK